MSDIAKWRKAMREMDTESLKKEHALLRAKFRIANGMLSKRGVSEGGSTSKSLRAPDKLWARAEEACEKLGVSFPDFVRQAIENECQEYEDKP